MTRRSQSVSALGVFAFLLLISWCPPASAQAAGGDDPAGRAERPVLVFTTFPSEGMGTLFERVLREAYDQLGYDVKIQRVPPERALVMSDMGEVDGEAARVAVVEPKCPNLIRVPTPVYINSVVGYSKRDDIDSSKGWDAIRPYRLGSVFGFKYIEKKTADMNRVLLSDYCVLFNMLQQDRIDVAVTEYIESLPKLQAACLEGVHLLSPPLCHEPMYHYLHKKHADLVPLVDKVLRSMMDAGRLDEIQHEMEQEFKHQFAQ